MPMRGLNSPGNLLAVTQGPSYKRVLSHTWERKIWPGQEEHSFVQSCSILWDVVYWMKIATASIQQRTWTDLQCQMPWVRWPTVSINCCASFAVWACMQSVHGPDCLCMQCLPVGLRTRLSHVIIAPVQRHLVAMPVFTSQAPSTWSMKMLEKMWACPGDATQSHTHTHTHTGLHLSGVS